MKSAWYEGLRPVEAEVDCGGCHHHVRWDRGRLRMLDHDLAAERALMALGGAKPPCIEVLDEWRRAQCDQTPQASHLPSPLNEMAAVTYVVRAERHGGEGWQFTVRRMLGDRLVRAVRESLAVGQGGRAAVKVSLSASLLPSGARPTLELTSMPRQLGMKISLTAAWIVQVWGAGMAAVDGHLVLDVVEPGARPAVLALRWDPGRAHTLQPVMTTLWLQRDTSGVWEIDSPDGPPLGRAWWSIRAWSR
jgi:hypothetical protein